MADGAGRGFNPDDDHGRADDAFAAVAFDEAFVRAALVREPSARERLLMVGPARLPLELVGTGPDDPVPADGADDPADDDGTPLELRPMRGFTPGLHGTPWQWQHPAPAGHWQRVVARTMVVVIGMITVLVTAAAVYRAAGGPHGGQLVPPQGPAPAATTGAAAGSAGGSAGGGTASVLSPVSR